MAKSLHIALFLLVILISQKPYFTTSKKVATGFSMELIPRDSPKSPLYPGNLTQTQRLERLVQFSKARTQYLAYSTMSSHNNNNTSNNNVISPQEARMKLLKSTFYYIVRTAIGNPATVLYLTMDTGGGLVWTQCLPCIKCFPQTVPLYDSTASTSYRKLPCSHFLCNGGPQSKYECVNNECVYNVKYGGGSGPTKGIASVETIWFMLTEGGIQAIDGIVFGCSNDNTNFNNFANTAISGVMGLSWSPDSLMTQLTDYVNNRFSYCIVPFNRDMPGSNGGVLSFGAAIPTPLGNLHSTTFAPRPQGSIKYYFYLNLLDISVGWANLNFPPGTFRINPDGSGGAIIDSGAPVSALINQNLPNGRNPYKEVIAEFQMYYDAKGLRRRTDVQLLDLCYEQPQDFKDFITMTYHLEGADYIVDGKNVNYFNKDGGYFCVGLSGGGISILGAWHQQNMRLIYNGDTNSLQFADEDCSLTR